jgi:hypothetical protein
MQIQQQDSNTVMLTAQAAASLLMGKKHLTFIGAERIQPHAEFRDDLMALTGCRLFRTRAEFKPGAPGIRVGTAVTRDPVYFVVFTPDTLEGRIATAAVVLKHYGDNVLHAIVRRQVEEPIVGLRAAPGNSEVGFELGTAYVIIVIALEALANGTAIDTSLN